MCGSRNRKSSQEPFSVAFSPTRTESLLSFYYLTGHIVSAQCAMELERILWRRTTRDHDARSFRFHSTYTIHLDSIGGTRGLLPTVTNFGGARPSELYIHGSNARRRVMVSAFKFICCDTKTFLHRSMQFQGGRLVRSTAQTPLSLRLLHR